MTEHLNAEILSQVDVIVCDGRDMEILCYTFTWIMSYVLEAAGKHAVVMTILASVQDKRFELRRDQWQGKIWWVSESRQ